MSAGSTRGVSDLSWWVALNRSGRAPLALSLLFWGTFVAHPVMVFYDIVTRPSVEVRASPSSLAEVLGIVHLLALPCVGLLWLGLTWAAGPTGRRPALFSLAFFAATYLTVLGAGGATVFVFSCLALANLTLVLGTRVAIICATAVAPAPIAVFAAQGKLSLGILEATILLFLNVAVILVVGALLAAQHNARHTSDLLVELEQAHTELRHYAERTRELSVSEERARMAREMHDSVGHYLTVINMGLANAERFRHIRPDDAWQEVADAKNLTQEALADTRRWVRALRPLRLEGRVGPEAMRTLAAAFSGGAGEMDVAFTVEGAWPELGEEAELVCYRVVQEGLTNAARHSAASRVSVEVDCAAEGVTVTVADNGRGAPGDAPAEGLGLDGLRERLHPVGGTLHAGPGPDGGYVLRAKVPTRQGTVDNTSTHGADA